MMNTRTRALLFSAMVAGCFALSQPLYAESKSEPAEVSEARRARDRASIEDLRKIITQTKKEADQTNGFEAYLRLALFQSWLCEAAEGHKEKSLVKESARDGVAAAEKAAALDPKSSEAHRLVGDLLGRLIPHIFGGGMRYGKRAADEMDKAIELDPRNAEAYVSRAISYFYTPEAFGGGKEKAFEMLRKATELDSQADTPHIWLALFSIEIGQKEEALREILRAREINAERAFTKTVYEQVTRAGKTPNDR